MKRMNEVFELPVDGVSQIVLNTHAIFRAVGYHEAVEHAAHAINNVDALADELEKLLAHIAQRNGRVTEAQFQESLSTLNAYRGSK